MKLALLIIGIIVIASGCVSQTAGEKEPIKIGAILPLTGPAAFYGGYATEAVQLAEEDINAAGVINSRPVNIVVEDSESAPSKGVIAFQKLAAQNVSVVLSMLSSVSVPVAEQADKARIPLITIVTTAKNITRGSPWVFRYYHTAESEAPALANYFYKIGKVKAAVIAINDEYGVSSTEEFSRAFSLAGGQIVAAEKFAPADTDFRTQLLKIKDAKPDALYIVGFDHHAIAIVKQAKELSINSTLGTTSLIANPTTQAGLSESAKEVYGTAGAFSLPNYTKAEMFKEKYRKRFGKESSAYSAYAYDAIMMLKDSIKSGDAESTRKNIEAINYHGLLGNVTFKPNHDADFGVYVLKLEKGKLVPTE